MNRVTVYLPICKGRPGTKLRELRGVVLHSVGVPGQSPMATRNYFTTVEASAHFIVKDDTVYELIPVDEVAYHAGKGYPSMTPLCVERLNSLPNLYTVGIEMAEDINHVVNAETIQTTRELLISEFHGLPFWTHGDLTGKQCPLINPTTGWWVDKLGLNSECI